MARVDVRRWEVIGLLVYCALLGVALLAPTSSTQSSMASWLADVGLSQTQAEFVCNILIIAPVSAIGSILWSRTTWLTWTALAFVGACAVEITQGALLPHRTASYVDVVANTLGGLLGALAVLAWRRVSRRRTAAGTPPSSQAAPRRPRDPRS